MRKKILLLAAMVVASSTTIDAQRKFPFFWKKKKAKTEQTTPAKKESEYDKLFKKKHEIAKGLITLHLLDGKVYFELPVNLINKDMLIGSTVTSISDNGNAVVGSKPTDLLHVVFTRNKTHVQLRQVNTDYITGNTQIDEALRKSTLGAILSNQKIQAYNNDSTAIVFDMSSVFLGDNKKMSPFDKNSIYGMYIPFWSYPWSSFSFHLFLLFYFNRKCTQKRQTNSFFCAEKLAVITARQLTIEKQGFLVYLVIFTTLFIKQKKNFFHVKDKLRKNFFT